MHVTAGDVTEVLDLVVTVVDNPKNYNVVIELNPDGLESIASKDVEFTVTVKNTGDAEDTVELEAVGDWSSWITLGTSEILLDAGTHGNVSGVFSIPSNATSGNKWIEIKGTSKNDPEKFYEEALKVVVEELETGATLRRDSVGLKTIAPSASDTFEYTLVSDGNSEQVLDILIGGSVAEWATSSISEAVLEAGGGTTFIVTVAIPEGTSEATYRLEVLIMNGNQELALSVSNVVVQEDVEEIMNIQLCLEATDDCFTWSPEGEIGTHSLEFNFDSEKLGQANLDFNITNQGNLDSIVAFEFATSDGTVTSNTLSVQDQEGKTIWMIGIVPDENLVLSGGDYGYGTLSIVGNKVPPGSYTYTFRWMQVIETETGSQLVDMGVISIIINVEGDEPQEETENEEGSLLPGPSFLSVILILATIVYRRRR
jgi:hypothetical protein